MTIRRHATAPSTVLQELQMMLVAELMAQPAAIVLSRQIVSIAQAAIGEIAAQVEVLEESAAAADRLQQELAIARADIARMELRMRVREVDASARSWDPSGKGKVERLHRRDAVVVDLGAILAREMGGTSRSQPSDGGDAA